MSTKNRRAEKPKPVNFELDQFEILPDIYDSKDFPKMEHDKRVSVRIPVPANVRGLYDEAFYNPEFPHSSSQIPYRLKAIGTRQELEEYLRNTPNLNWYDQQYLQRRIDDEKFFEEFGKTPHEVKTKAPVMHPDGVLQLDHIHLNEDQYTGMGCYSCSYMLLLQSRGIDLKQEQIRSYRPRGEFVDVKDQERMLGDNIANVVEMGGIATNYLKNTAIAEFNFSYEQEWDRETGRLKPNPARHSQQYAEQIKKTILEGLVKHHSPVSLLRGMHYVTIVGYDTKTGEFIIKNSVNHADPDRDDRITLADIVSRDKIVLNYAMSIDPEKPTENLKAAGMNNVEFINGHYYQIGEYDTNLPANALDKEGTLLTKTDTVAPQEIVVRHVRVPNKIYPTREMEQQGRQIPSSEIRGIEESPKREFLNDLNAKLFGLIPADAKLVIKASPKNAQSKLDGKNVNFEFSIVKSDGSKEAISVNTFIKYYYYNQLRKKLGNLTQMQTEFARKPAHLQTYLGNKLENPESEILKGYFKDTEINKEILALLQRPELKSKTAELESIPFDPKGLIGTKDPVYDDPNKVMKAYAVPQGHLAGSPETWNEEYLSPEELNKLGKPQKAKKDYFDFNFFDPNFFVPDYKKKETKKYVVKKPTRKLLISDFIMKNSKKKLFNPDEYGGYVSEKDYGKLIKQLGTGKYPRANNKSKGEIVGDAASDDMMDELIKKFNEEDKQLNKVKIAPVNKPVEKPQKTEIKTENKKPEIPVSTAAQSKTADKKPGTSERIEKFNAKLWEIALNEDEFLKGLEKGPFRDFIEFANEKRQDLITVMMDAKHTTEERLPEAAFCARMVLGARLLTLERAANGGKLPSKGDSFKTMKGIIDYVNTNLAKYDNTFFSNEKNLTQGIAKFILNDKAATMAKNILTSGLKKDKMTDPKVQKALWAIDDAMDPKHETALLENAYRAMTLADPWYISSSQNFKDTKQALEEIIRIRKDELPLRKNGNYYEHYAAKRLSEAYSKLDAAAEAYVKSKGDKKLEDNSWGKLRMDAIKEVKFIANDRKAYYTERDKKFENKDMNKEKEENTLNLSNFAL